MERHSPAQATTSTCTKLRHLVQGSMPRWNHTDIGLPSLLNVSLAIKHACIQSTAADQVCSPQLHQQHETDLTVIATGKPHKTALESVHTGAPAAAPAVPAAAQPAAALSARHMG